MNSDKPTYKIVESLNTQWGVDAFLFEVSYVYDESIGQYVCKQSLDPVAHGLIDLQVKWSGMTPEILYDIADRMTEMEQKLGIR